MALDDICTCGHQKRYHSGNAQCIVRIPVAGGNLNPLEADETTCECSEFNDRFAVPDIEDDLALGGFVADLQKQMAEMAAMFAPLKAEHEAALLTVKELDDARRAAMQKANAVESAMKQYQLLLNKAEAATEVAARKIRQAEELKRRQAELRELSNEFDLITAGAPWREWAYPFQLDDAKVASLAKRCIIGNTMGTGKTLISQIICDMLKSERVLIFTPATVMRPFIQEVKRWSPHRKVYLVGGMNKSERRAIVNLLTMSKDAGMGFTVVLNYEAMRKDNAFIEELKSLEFDTVILDEAHNFKDKKSLTFRQVKELVNGDGHQPANVFPMTGSPILNKPQDLWPLLNLIEPYDFYDERAFLSQYCAQDWETGKWRFTSSGLNGLQRKLRDKFIRRTKDQTGISLPEKTIQVHDITLDPVLHPRQFRANADLNTQAAIFLEDGKGKSITTTLALITRKRQMMTMPSGIKWTDNDQDSPTFGQVIFQCDVEESVKLDYIIHPNGDSDNPTYDDAEGLLPELVNDEKVVLFSQFKAPLQELARRCKAAGINAAIIDGDVPMDRRQEIIETFQNKPLGASDGIDVVLGNFKAMGVGVTLHAASQMIILDEEWNPGKNEQAYDRIHRFGQEKPVTIHILRVENSVDDWMAAIIEDKAALVDGFMNTVPVTAGDLLDKIKGGML